MDANARRLQAKTQLFTLIVIVCNPLGNYFLTRGMKSFTGELSLSPVGYIAAIFTPWVALGISLLIIWLLTRMTLFGWADLSYVVPVTALGYVLSALTGRFFLDEQISGQRWAGTLLIVAGTVIVGRTSVHTRGAV